MTSTELDERVPAHVPRELVRHLDHHNDPDVRANPSGYLDGLRADFPVFYSPVYEGFWVLTRFEDMRWVLQHPEIFSSNLMGVPGWAPGGSPLLPIMLDPPEHGKYRALINPAFAPKQIRLLEPVMRNTATELVRDLVGNGSCEFIADFASPFSTRMFTQMLGLPIGEAGRFVAWNDALLHTPPIGDGVLKRQQAAGEISGYLDEVITERSAQPGQDMISTLLTTEIDGRGLTRDEVQRISMLLFMAGLDTVTASHGFAWKALAERPELRAEIVRNPECIPNAVEELLRYNSIFSDARTVTAPIDIAGVRMLPGDRVMIPTYTAGRDPDVFDDPDTVDFHRKGRPHLAFGAGPHRCVGSHLARLEMNVSLEVWHAAIPDYRIPDGQQISMHCGGVAGLSELPLTW